MVTVIASITVRDGKRERFLEAFNANVPNVLAENGCLEYYPSVDLPSGLAAQIVDPRVVTIVEKWESVEALQAHARAPHMLAYREQVKDLVEDTSLKVLQGA